MTVNFCSNCGEKLRAGAKYCGSCGQKIYSEEKKLPPMPYEQSKNLMERYAELKAQNTAKVGLQKSAPPKSVADMFAEAKKNTQTEPIAKSSPPPKPLPNPLPPKPVANSTARPTYPPPKDLTPPFAPAYREGVTIKEKFFSTEGRLNRQRYFNRTLLVNLAGIVLIGIISVICSTPWGDTTPTGEALIGIVGVAVLIPKYCLDVRRLKDIGIALPGMKPELCTESSFQMTAATCAVLGLINMYLMKDWSLESRMPLPDYAKFFSSVITVFWLWMQCKSGTVGANKFGEDPLADERRMNL